MLNLGVVKKDFTSLMENLHPWMLSHFVMWLDIKVAEYKVYGHMVFDDTPNDTPKWLRGQSSHHPTDKSTTDGNESWSESVQSSNNRQSVTSSRISTLHTNPSHADNQPPSQHSPKISTFQPTHSATQRLPPALTRHSPNRPEVVFEHSSPSICGPDSGNQNVSVCPQQDQRHKQFEHQNSMQTVLHDIKLSHIQLQERWSKEIEKSVLQTGGITNNSSTKREQEDKPSRSTIVLGEPLQMEEELQQRLTPMESNEMPTKMSSESAIEDVIKIELSSDDESQMDNYSSVQSRTICENTQEGEHSSSSGLMDFDPKEYSLQESNLREVADDISPVPISLHAVKSNQRAASKGNSDGDVSWKNKKWEYFEKLRKSRTSSYVGAKVHSQSLQNLLPFPDPFPLDKLHYGMRAQEMINTGKVTRSGKMQFLDTVFYEVVKYTGLYPTPQQKMDVARAIINTFPKLDVASSPNNGSSVDQWLVTLNDKFRNERRMLHHGPYLSRQRIPGLQYSTTNTETNDVS